MEWLNYHHLFYFWTVVREGGVAKAAKKLRLAHPTVSGQIKTLERALGEVLLERRGRALALTEMGTLVFGYAEEIFHLGRDLLDVVRGRPANRPQRLRVGIADPVPKLIAREVLAPASRPELALQLVCREDKADRLIAELTAHTLDVVLTDAPVPPGSTARVFNHFLGECGLAVVGRPALARRYRRGFPGSLDGAPLYLPTSQSAQRRTLDAWFDHQRLRPRVIAEFDDSALLKAFGEGGAALFVVPLAIERAIARQYGVVRVGVLAGVHERFYAVSAERRVRHPGVAAICEAARGNLFA